MIERLRPPLRTPERNLGLPSAGDGWLRAPTAVMVVIALGMFLVPAGPAAGALLTSGSPDIGLPDADSTLGPWPVDWPAPRFAAPAADSSSPLTSAAQIIDRLKGRVRRLRQAADEIDRHLHTIRAALEILRVSQLSRALPDATGSSGWFQVTLEVPTAGHLVSGGDLDSPVSGAAGALEGGATLGAPTATARSALLVRIIIESAAVFFLVAVLFIPLGCSLAAAGVGGRQRDPAGGTMVG